MATARITKRHRLLFRWCGLTLACTILVACIVAVAARRGQEAVPAAGADLDSLTSVLTRREADIPSPIRFEDATARLKIDFHHFPAGRQSLLPEDVGSGVACGDFDGDGFADLYFVNFSGSVSPGSPIDASMGSSRLYRNVGGQHFEDVTETAGTGFVGFGMGAAWGDYDSDGDVDLYVTAYGDNVLYENRGNGTFEDVTERSGTNDPRFSMGCSWADYDRDGDLDLYVCNYVNFVYRGSDRGVVERQFAPGRQASHLWHGIPRGWWRGPRNARTSWFWRSKT